MVHNDLIFVSLFNLGQVGCIITSFVATLFCKIAFLCRRLDEHELRLQMKLAFAIVLASS